MEIYSRDWDKIDQSFLLKSIVESSELIDEEESFDSLTFSEVCKKAISDKNERIMKEREAFINKAKEEMYRMISEDFEYVVIDIKDRFNRESIHIVNEVIGEIKLCGFKVEVLKEKYGSQTIRIYSR